MTEAKLNNENGQQPFFQKIMDKIKNNKSMFCSIFGLILINFWFLILSLIKYGNLGFLSICMMLVNFMDVVPMISFGFLSYAVLIYKFPLDLDEDKLKKWFFVFGINVTSLKILIIIIMIYLRIYNFDNNGKYNIIFFSGTILSLFVLSIVYLFKICNFFFQKIKKIYSPKYVVLDENNPILKV